MSGLTELAETYYKIESQIKKRLKELPNYDKNCQCEDAEEFVMIGKESDIVYCVCLKCGGNHE
jgi:hypothetical protein